MSNGWITAGTVLLLLRHFDNKRTVPLLAQKSRKRFGSYVNSSYLCSETVNCMFSIKDISEYIVLLIAAFASHYNMADAEAYRYLSRYGAIKVAHDFYDVMHTQPMDDMVQSMSTYCHRKGGEL